jgi:Leucine-rich repeat (LRR) protein
LKTLCLHRNALRELPPLPASLTRLLASGNNLDEISTVTDCLDLVQLDLERNKVVFLPDDLADLHSLERINVSKNLLSSLEVPGMSRRAPKLREFKIASNPLGSMPWWLADVSAGALEDIFSQDCKVGASLSVI